MNVPIYPKYLEALVFIISLMKQKIKEKNVELIIDVLAESTIKNGCLGFRTRVIELIAPIFCALCYSFKRGIQKSYKQFCIFNAINIYSIIKSFNVKTFYDIIELNFISSV